MLNMRVVLVLVLFFLYASSSFAQTDGCCACDVDSTRNKYPEAFYWLVQSMQSLKTFNNYACCLTCCPEYADELALSENYKTVSLWGNPYYERCPHCLVRIERSGGSSHMECRNCKMSYRARSQVECPCLACSTGCHKCLLCWVIAPCETGKCKIPCCYGVPRFCADKKEFIGQCAAMQARETKTETWEEWEEEL